MRDWLAELQNEKPPASAYAESAEHVDSDNSADSADIAYGVETAKRISDKPQSGTTPERHAELMAAAKRDPDLVRNQYGGYSPRPDAVINPPPPEPSPVVEQALQAAVGGLSATARELYALLDGDDVADIEAGIDVSAVLRDLAKGIHNRRAAKQIANDAPLAANGLTVITDNGGRHRKHV